MNDNTGTETHTRKMVSAARWFVILYEPGPAWLAGKPMAEQNLAPHRDYIELLASQGRVLTGGPFIDEAGGMLVVRAGTEATAAAILSGDPGVSSGILTGNIKAYRPLVGVGAASADSHDQRATNIDLVRRLFALVESRGDPADLATRLAAYEANYDQDVVIHEPLSLPYGGDYSGDGAVARHAHGYNTAWEGLQSDSDRGLEPKFFADQNQVVVLWRQKGRSSCGQRFDMEAASVYRIKDGRVVDARMFHFDTASVRDFLERGRFSEAPEN
jgi:ketosteroid isomerase-like protein/uncharacterized protein YciI